MTSRIIKYDACDLSKLIEKVYGQEFNVPYQIMQEQRKITTTVSNEKWPGLEELVEQFKQTGNCQDADNIFEALLTDLCIRKLLKKGEYLIEFDD